MTCKCNHVEATHWKKERECLGNNCQNNCGNLEDYNKAMKAFRSYYG